ncbi:MAG: hypothetical protein WA081_00390 [Desulfosalsimonadaceae bacterium]
MQVHHKAFAHLVQGDTKPRAFSISGISSHPAKTKAVFSGAGDHAKGQLIFGVKGARFFRNAGLITSLRIFGPFFWQVQPGIDRQGKPAFGQNAENRHLSVVDLAKSAKPLPRCANRHLPLLGKGTLIDQKSGHLIVADQFNAIAGNMVDHCLRIPFAVGKKLLKIPGFGVRDNLGQSGPCFYVNLPASGRWRIAGPFP